MIALYIVLPLALLVAGAAVVAFTWSVRSGQLDDLDTPPQRILFDDEPVARGGGVDKRAASLERGQGEFGTTDLSTLD